MPVTIQPAAHQPKLHPQIDHAGTVNELLQRSCPDTFSRSESHAAFSSFGRGDDARVPNDVYPSSSSFVRCAIEAWGRHSHLRIRPDDVWFTVLVQMNFFMHKNAESLRDLFVDHEEKEIISIVADTWSEVVDEFRKETQKKIKTPWMGDWISPGFSTSTHADEQTATVLMMGLMKAFFKYEGGEICGIPSITLLGTKEDWQRLLSKIDRLNDFGPEPKAYGDRLRPLLTRFVSTFDNPAAEETKAFWDQMVQAKVRHEHGCGLPPTQYFVSGWILGFFFWNGQGEVSPDFTQEYRMSRRGELLEYDGMLYGTVPLEDIPVGYAKAQFKLLSGAPPDLCDGWILAGSIGKVIKDGAPDAYIQPEPGTATHGDILQKDGSDTKIGCLSGMLRALSCFSKDEPSAHEGQSWDEKRGVRSRKVKASAPYGHSTIQPASGWFLFYPELDVGPFFDGEEISGPTVDAIDSCDGVKHENAR